MNILEEAGDITAGDRNKYYGAPADNHGNTAALWMEYIHRKHGVRIGLNARDVCLMMILLKVSRDANAPKRDNLVDICGYARNAEQIEERVDEKAREDFSDNWLAKAQAASKFRRESNTPWDAPAFIGPAHGGASSSPLDANSTVPTPRSTPRRDRDYPTADQIAKQAQRERSMYVPPVNKWRGSPIDEPGKAMPGVPVEGEGFVLDPVGIPEHPLYLPVNKWHGIPIENGEDTPPSPKFRRRTD